MFEGNIFPTYLPLATEPEVSKQPNEAWPSDDKHQVDLQEQGSLQKIRIQINNNKTQDNKHYFVLDNITARLTSHWQLWKEHWERDDFFFFFALLSDSLNWMVCALQKW